MPKFLRRSIVDQFSPASDEHQAIENARQNLPSSEEQSSQPVEQSRVSHDVLSTLRVAQVHQRHASQRHWDAQHRQGQVSYRGFPAEIQAGVNRLADHLNVSANDIARACLEFGLAAYRAGNLQLWGSYRGSRLTLFPDTKATPTSVHAGQRKKKDRQKSWKHVVSYRGFPESDRIAVKEIAQQRSVPMGQVAAALIDYGLKAYAEGTFTLIPYVKSGSAHTLFGASE